MTRTVKKASDWLLYYWNQKVCFRYASRICPLTFSQSRLTIFLSFSKEEKNARATTGNMTVFAVVLHCQKQDSEPPGPRHAQGI
jgi:hypothetical protein